LFALRIREHDLFALRMREDGLFALRMREDGLFALRNEICFLKFEIETWARLDKKHKRAWDMLRTRLSQDNNFKGFQI
jgi:hypothetical protein